MSHVVLVRLPDMRCHRALLLPLLSLVPLPPSFSPCATCGGSLYNPLRLPMLVPADHGSLLSEEGN